MYSILLDGGVDLGFGLATSWEDIAIIVAVIGGAIVALAKVRDSLFRLIGFKGFKEIFTRLDHCKSQISALEKEQAELKATLQRAIDERHKKDKENAEQFGTLNANIKNLGETKKRGFLG